MGHADKTINCCSCSANFLFTAAEQEFFHLKGLVNEPRRCPGCRLSMRLKRAGAQQPITSVNCAQCGQATQVPFAPRGHRPVYCNACFHIQKKAAEAIAATNPQTADFDHPFFQTLECLSS